MGTVYLGGAVDLSPDHIEKEQMSRVLSEAGHVVYQPWRVFAVNGDMSGAKGRSIREVNFAAIGACSGVLAVMSHDQFTFGTVVDVEYAREIGKPTVIWLIGTQKVPAYLAGYDLVWSPTFNLDSMREAMELLDSRMKESPVLRTIRNLPSVIEKARLAQARTRAVEAEDGPSVHSETHLRLACAVDDGHQAPTKAYEGDAGFDLYIKGVQWAQPNAWADIHVGTKVAIPDGHWGLLLGRSSTFYSRGLTVHPAVIDASWRGEMRISVHNPSSERVKLDDGERIAQLILIPLPKVRIDVVEELPPGERGECGFGSSGK